MIDHLLGRPSVKSRRLQVLAVLSFWSIYVVRGDRHGPRFIRFLSRLLSKRLTAWQTVVMTMMYLYAARNFSTLVGLACPDPLSKLYDPTYFRATWVLTALDAGFWTAMRIKNKALRDLASIVFSLFYLVAAEQADEKVRKVRGNITIDHLRVSWNKGTESPYLSFVQGLMRPHFTRWTPRRMHIQRPSSSDYKEPVAAWLYFDGHLTELKRQTSVILDIPGGGFVAMNPRCSDDKLLAWAAKTGLPILSVDYKKAPEYPYPYALNECYDVYTAIINSRGRCIGLSGDIVPNVVITGDSAGGNLAMSTTLMIIERGSSAVRRFQGQRDLPIPAGLMLFYPALDMNIGSWMSDEQMALIKDRQMRRTNQRIIKRKAMQYDHLVGTPHQSDDEDDATANNNNTSSSKSLSSTGTEEAPFGSPPTDPSLPTGGGHECEPAPEYAHSLSTTFSQVHQHVPPSSPAPTPSQTPATSGPSSSSSSSKNKGKARDQTQGTSSHHPQPMRTRLAMSSMISYFNDRVLTPEMMRAMVILYVGPHNRPDFTQDYLLSPILAPDSLLARFPKTYLLTGERDPLVDDTIVLAGRLRRVKAALMASGGTRTEYRDSDALTEGFDAKKVAEVTLIPGISHGFLQFPSLYPPAWKLIERSAGWVMDVFEEVERREMEQRGRGRTREARVEGEAEEGVGNSSSSSGGAGTGTGSEKGREKGKEHGGDEEVEEGLEIAGKAKRKVTAKEGDAGNGGQQEKDGKDDGKEEREEVRGDGNGDANGMTKTEAKGNDKARAGPPGAVRFTLDKGGMMRNAHDEGSDRHDDNSNDSGQDKDNAGGEGGSSTSGKKKGGAEQKKKKKGGARGKKSKAAGDGDDGDRGLVKLASSEDLLGRRMQGLAGGLTGLREDSE
ncbi:hypothetical protein VTK26DRAFT_6355 [Humicola hyalothermophila]